MNDQIEAEMAAMQVVLLTLVQAQPEQAAFAARLDKFISNLQTEAAADPRGRPMPEDFRVALQRWRANILANRDGPG